MEGGRKGKREGKKKETEGEMRKGGGGGKKKDKEGNGAREKEGLNLREEPTVYSPPQPFEKLVGISTRWKATHRRS
jgi:hypothetical protein